MADTYSYLVSKDITSAGTYTWEGVDYVYNSMTGNAAFTNIGPAFNGSPEKVTVLAGSYTASTDSWFVNGANMTVSNQKFKTEGDPEYAATSVTLTGETGILKNTGSLTIKNVDTAATPAAISFEVKQLDNSGSVTLDGASFTATTVAGPGTFYVSNSDVNAAFDGGEINLTGLCGDGTAISGTANITATNVTLNGTASVAGKNLTVAAGNGIDLYGTASLIFTGEVAVNGHIYAFGTNTLVFGENFSGSAIISARANATLTNSDIKRTVYFGKDTKILGTSNIKTISIKGTSKTPGDDGYRNLTITGTLTSEKIDTGSSSAGNSAFITFENAIATVDVLSMTGDSVFTITNSTVMSKQVNLSGIINVTGDSTLVFKGVYPNTTLGPSTINVGGATLKDTEIASSAATVAIAATTTLTIKGKNTILSAIDNKGTIVFAADGTESALLIGDVASGTISISNAAVGINAQNHSAKVIDGTVGPAATVTTDEGTNQVTLNGDLYLTTETKATLYVNADYDTVGEVVDGHLVGYNAFNSLTAALNAAVVNTTTEIIVDSSDVVSGLDMVSTTASGIAINAATGKTPTVELGFADGDNGLMLFAGENGTTIGSGVTIKTNHTGSVEDNGAVYLNYGATIGKITVDGTIESAAPIKIYADAKITGNLKAGTDTNESFILFNAGKTLALDASETNKGKVTIEKKSTDSAAPTVNATWFLWTSGDVDTTDAEITVTGFRFIDSIDNGTTPLPDTFFKNGKVTLTSKDTTWTVGFVEAADTAITKNAVIDLDNSVFAVSGETGNNGVGAAAQIGDKIAVNLKNKAQFNVKNGTLENAGKITMSGAKLEAKKLVKTGNGSVSVATGSNTFDIDDLEGTITLKTNNTSKTFITNSNIVGKNGVVEISSASSKGVYFTVDNTVTADIVNNGKMFVSNTGAANMTAGTIQNNAQLTVNALGSLTATTINIGQANDPNTDANEAVNGSFTLNGTLIGATVESFADSTFTVGASAVLNGVTLKGVAINNDAATLTVNGTLTVNTDSAITVKNINFGTGADAGSITVKDDGGDWGTETFKTVFTLGSSASAAAVLSKATGDGVVLVQGQGADAVSIYAAKSTPEIKSSIAVKANWGEPGDEEKAFGEVCIVDGDEYHYGFDAFNNLATFTSTSDTVTSPVCKADTIVFVKGSDTIETTGRRYFYTDNTDTREAGNLVKAAVTLKGGHEGVAAATPVSVTIDSERLYLLHAVEGTGGQTEAAVTGYATKVAAAAANAPTFEIADNLNLEVTGVLYVGNQKDHDDPPLTDISTVDNRQGGVANLLVKGTLNAVSNINVASFCNLDVTNTGKLTVGNFIIREMANASIDGGANYAKPETITEDSYQFKVDQLQLIREGSIMLNNTLAKIDHFTYDVAQTKDWNVGADAEKPWTHRSLVTETAGKNVLTLNNSYLKSTAESTAGKFFEDEWNHIKFAVDDKYQAIVTLNGSEWDNSGNSLNPMAQTTINVNASSVATGTIDAAKGATINVNASYKDKEEATHYGNASVTATGAVENSGTIELTGAKDTSVNPAKVYTATLSANSIEDKAGGEITANADSVIETTEGYIERGKLTLTDATLSVGSAIQNRNGTIKATGSEIGANQFIGGLGTTNLVNTDFTMRNLLTIENANAIFNVVTTGSNESNVKVNGVGRVDNAGTININQEAPEGATLSTDKTATQITAKKIVNTGAINASYATIEADEVSGAGTFEFANVDLTGASVSSTLNFSGTANTIALSTATDNKAELATINLNDGAAISGSIYAADDKGGTIAVGTHGEEPGVGNVVTIGNLNAAKTTVSNSGTINATGDLSAGTVTNKADAIINVGVADNKTTDADESVKATVTATVLDNSGTINAYSGSEITATPLKNAGTINAYSGSTITAAGADSDRSTNIGADVDHKAKINLDASTLTGTGYLNLGNGVLKATNGSTISKSIDTAYTGAVGNAEIIIENSTVNADIVDASKATFTVAGTSTLSGGFAGKINLLNNAVLTASSIVGFGTHLEVDVDAGSTVSFSGNNTVTNLTNGGTINLNAADTLTVKGAITNTGAITITGDLSAKTLITADSGLITAAPTITINGTTAVNGAKIGDYTIALSDTALSLVAAQDRSTLYVNALYPEGVAPHVYGYNAFDNLGSAVANMDTTSSTGKTTKIEVASSKDVTVGANTDLTIGAVAIEAKEGLTDDVPVTIAFDGADKGLYLNPGVSISDVDITTTAANGDAWTGSVYVNFDAEPGTVTLGGDINAAGHIYFRGAADVSGNLTVPHGTEAEDRLVLLRAGKANTADSTANAKVTIGRAANNAITDAQVSGAWIVLVSGDAKFENTVINVARLGYDNYSADATEYKFTPTLTSNDTQWTLEQIDLANTKSTDSPKAAVFTFANSKVNVTGKVDLGSFIEMNVSGEIKKGTDVLTNLSAATIINSGTLNATKKAKIVVSGTIDNEGIITSDVTTATSTIQANEILNSNEITASSVTGSDSILNTGTITATTLNVGELANENVSDTVAGKINATTINATDRIVNKGSIVATSIISTVAATATAINNSGTIGAYDATDSTKCVNVNINAIGTVSNAATGTIYADTLTAAEIATSGTLVVADATNVSGRIYVNSGEATFNGDVTAHDLWGKAGAVINIEGSDPKNLLNVNIESTIGDPGTFNITNANLDGNWFYCADATTMNIIGKNSLNGVTLDGAMNLVGASLSGASVTAGTLRAAAVTVKNGVDANDEPVITSFSGINTFSGTLTVAADATLAINAATSIAGEGVSLVVNGSFVNNGAITIDATGLTWGTPWTPLQVVSATSVTSNTNITVVTDPGVKALAIANDNGIYLINADVDTKTIYVNDAWKSLDPGTVLSFDGGNKNVMIGVNGFGSTNVSMTEKTHTIKLVAGTYTDQTLELNSQIKNLVIMANGTETAATIGALTVDADAKVATTGKLVATGSSAINGELNAKGADVAFKAITGTGKIYTDIDSELSFTGFNGTTDIDVTGMNSDKDKEFATTGSSIDKFVASGKNVADGTPAAKYFNYGTTTGLTQIDEARNEVTATIADFDVNATTKSITPKAINSGINYSWTGADSKTYYADNVFISGTFGDTTNQARTYLSLNDNQTAIITGDDTKFAYALYGGSYVDSNAGATGRHYKELGGQIGLVIEDGTFNKAVTAGDCITVAGNFYRDADCNLTINGGKFLSNVAAGVMYSSKELGANISLFNTNLTITGGVFASNGFVYGGNNALSKTSATGVKLVKDEDGNGGNSTVTIQAGDKKIDIGGLVVGSYGQGIVMGNTKLILSGKVSDERDVAKDQLSFKSIWGGSSGDTINSTTREYTGYVQGERILSFTGFQGYLVCDSINDFSAVEVTGTKATLSDAQSVNLVDVKNWDFELDSTISGAFQNDFTGDTLVLNGIEDMASGASWTLFDNMSADAVDTFDNFTKVVFGTTAVTEMSDNAWVCGDYSLAIKDNNKMVLTLA